MNKKNNNMSLEYRIGMITAFSLLLLSIFLPLIAIEQFGISEKISLFQVFTKGNWYSYLDLGGANLRGVILGARMVLVIYILLLIGGIVCYALDVAGRLKEGLIIALILTPWQAFSVILLAGIGMQMSGAARVGIGAILSTLACIYAFYRPLVYLCMYKSKDGNKKAASTKAKGQLVGISGIYKDQIIPLQDGVPLVIGRDSSECNLLYNKETAPKVSKVHCRVTFNKKEGTFLVKDCGSLNGTYKGNGTRLENSVSLQPGSRFYIATADNTFEVL